MKKIGTDLKKKVVMGQPVLRLRILMVLLHAIMR